MQIEPLLMTSRCTLQVISSLVPPSEALGARTLPLERRHHFFHKEFNPIGLWEIVQTHDQIFDAGVDKALQLLAHLREVEERFRTLRVPTLRGYGIVRG